MYPYEDRIRATQLYIKFRGGGADADSGLVHTVTTIAANGAGRAPLTAPMATNENIELLSASDVFTGTHLNPPQKPV
jgi:hypothetical protein